MLAMTLPACGPSHFEYVKQQAQQKSRSTSSKPAPSKSAPKKQVIPPLVSKTKSTAKTTPSKPKYTARQPSIQREATDQGKHPIAPAQPISISSSFITAQAGETLYSLSRRSGVEVRDLVVANDLEPPYTLRIGQRLVVPSTRYHLVQDGETGYSISRAYGIDLTILARVNGLVPPYSVFVGQRLKLPSDAKMAASIEPAPPSNSAKPAISSPPSNRPMSSPLPDPAKFSASFNWPIEGRILSSFGPKAGGLHNDGINIAAPVGATVRASGDGIVAYAGNGLAGFGWLLLIKHEDGWVTAYGHNQELLVKRGATVARGEAIARVGATGAVERPQLHFEIRRGRQAIDPLSLLSKRQTSPAW